MADIEDIIAEAKLPERSITLCLRGDLQAQWEDLERKLQRAEANSDDTLAGDPEAQALAEQMEALAERMRATERTFLFRGLGSKEYSDLLAANKAPADKQDEAVDGLDWSTYPTALIAACAVDPAMTFEQAERLSNVLTNRQWDDLFSTALACNRSKVDVPFSLSASAIRAASAPRSPQPEPGASPAQSSSDESLAG